MSGATALVAELAATRGCWSPALSPDGSRVAYVSDAGGAPRAYVARLEDLAGAGPGEGESLAVPDDGDVETVSWSRTPPGAPGWLLLAGGGGLRAVAADAGPAGPVADAGPAGPGGPAAIAATRPIEGPLGGTAFAGCWLPGRPTYAFTAVGPDDAHVVALDVETGARAVLAEGGGLLVTDVSAQGLPILRRGPRGRRHLVVPTPDGELRRLVPRDLAGGSEDGRFAPDGSGIWLRTEAGRDRMALAHVPWPGDGSGPGPLRIVAERDDAELERYVLSGDGTTIVLEWNVGGASELEVLRTATHERTTITGIAYGVVGGLALSHEGTACVVELSTPATPRALMHLGLGRPRTAARPLTAAGPTGARLVTPETVTIEAHDGVPLAALLYRPAGATGPLPTVVSLHGGPEAQTRPELAPLHQSLVAAGIAVLAPNVRGSSGYGRAFVELDSGLRRLDAVRDVETCAGWLVAGGLAEPTRLGVHGTSYGGYLGLASIVEHPATFAAAASVCGIADFLTFFAGTEPWIATAARTKYGDPTVDAALLRRLSPLSGLHEARTPTLLVHGEEDTNVPVAEARAAHAALLSGGVPSELVVLPGEGHSLLRPGSRLAELTAVVRWFERWL